MRRRSFLASSAALPALTQAALPEDILVRAMRDEIRRSMKKLQLENLEKPYFLAYRIVETHSVQSAASFGALESSSETKRRLLSTECRVGSPQLDNTNFYAARTALSGVVRINAGFGSSLSLDDDYEEFRRQLWLSTDSAYKQAVDDIAKKRAALENRTRTGAAIADFSQEPKTETVEMIRGEILTLERAETLAKQLSLLFRKAAGIDYSGVRVSSTRTITRFVSSEGTEIWRAVPETTITWYADAQAPDGMPIVDAENAVFTTTEDITANINAFVDRILRLRKAPTIQRYAGPVLFEPAAAAELFSQAFATNLLGIPRLVVDDQRFEAIFATSGPFSDKISTRVLPSHMRVTDDPTRPNMPGSYKVDEEGVTAKPTILVQGGILKRLLNTRAIVPGVTDSTASRRPNGVSPSNLIVDSTKGTPIADLRRDLLQFVKDRNLEYGIVIRKIANPTDSFARPRSRNIIMTSGIGQQSIPIAPIIEAIRVFPDGREELIRNLEISGFTTAAFRDLAGISTEKATLAIPFRNPRISPLTGGPILFSRVLIGMEMPALLLEDVTLRIPAGETPKLPIVPHPSFG
ncbi:MAG: metallopeptidase TldD-related protein [Acidobacteriota bacterium]